ncbi:MAG: TIGR00730 family Rossman fold protein [Bacteroidales bacterium]|nr:TIGR00730 family Rossman fold protein [Bacteroidales bacterium]
MRAVFFCSSVKDIAPEYNDAARKSVRAACGRGYDIVSGGTVKGTMGVVCDEAAACGAVVRGILPRFMKGLEHPALTDLVWTDTMSERKELLREGADIVVALPGGIGTMDEFFETFVLVKLGRIDSRLAVLNIGGFYDPLKQLLEHFVATNMLDREHLDLVHFCSSVEEFEELL